MALIALALLLSYLAGSVPFGLLIARAKTGKDVRSVGSGNIGATNVARAAGRPAAIATLVLDALKALAPVLLGARFGPQLGAPWLGAACGVLAVLGHCFPVWLRFRGGKGVATGLGVSLALSPLAALCAALVWLAVWKLWRISSVASLSGVAVALAATAFTAPGAPLLGLAAVSAIIVVRHEGNLRRLLRRQER